MSEYVALRLPLPGSLSLGLSLAPGPYPSVRLRALADAPKTFVSDHSREVGWLRRTRRSAIQQARWVVARTAHGVIGVARSSQDPESPERRYIEAVWVAPEFRRLGVGRRLVRWLIDHERKSGIKEILLWVINSNVYARSFYLRWASGPPVAYNLFQVERRGPKKSLAYVIGR